MKTGFCISSGQDLGTIFKHRDPADAPVPPTGFRVQDGRDLADVFAPYTGGKKADPVGFRIADGRDLCEIFAVHAASASG